MPVFGFRVINDSELPPIMMAHKADPQKIGEALMEIDQNFSKIKPAAVVDAARSVDNPLHPHFEWDDSIAAESHRIQQARNLVRCITILPSKSKGRSITGERPAFLSITTDDGERGYRPLKVILNNRELRRQVLANAHRDLLAWEKRYNMLVDVCNIVRSARDKLSEKMTSGMEDHTPPM